MVIRKKWAVPMDSYSKMIIWLHNGNIITFYSLDWKSSHSHLKDRATGLQRFKNKIAQYIPHARKIKIYDLASECLIASYESN